MSLTKGRTRDELTLLADPALLKQRMDQLKGAEDTAQAVLELVGPAQEILAIREQADEVAKATLRREEASLEQAEQTVSDAEAKAQDIVERAEQKAKLILDEATTQQTDNEKVRNELQTELDKVGAESIRMEEWSEALGTAQEELAQRESSLVEKTESLLKEKTVLAGIREQMNSFLG